MTPTYSPYSKLFIGTKAVFIPMILLAVTPILSVLHIEITNGSYVTWHTFFSTILIVIIEAVFLFSAGRLNKIEVRYKKKSLNKQIEELTALLSGESDRAIRNEVDAKIKQLKSTLIQLV